MLSTSLLPKSSVQSSDKNYSFCCHNCPSSIEHLFWSCSLVSNCQNTSKNNSFRILICALNFSDLACALPYVIFQVANVTFQDYFALHEHSWRQNPVCFMAFCVFLNFSLFPILLCLIALSRLLAVSKPLNNFKETQFVSKCIGSIFLFVFICAAALTSQIFFEDYGLPNSFCFPITNQSDGNHIIRFVSGIIACWKVSLFLVLFTMNINVIKLVKNSQQELKDFVSKQRTSKSITVHVAIQMFCLSICWIPCVVLCSFLLFDNEYPLEVLVLVMTAIFPIVSVLNPLIFNITMVRNHFHCLISGQKQKKQDLRSGK